MIKEKDNLAETLNILLEENKDKRIIVIGTTCTGKTTLLKNIKNAYDMDDLVFPLLTKEEEEYVCQSPWTPEIGKTMGRLVKERVKAEKGKPLFGTVLLDCDLIVYLKITDKRLKERVSSRNSVFEDAKNMQKSIENEIKKSNIPVVRFLIR